MVKIESEYVTDVSNEACRYVKEGKNLVSKALGRLFEVLASIKKDPDARTHFLKAMRYTVIACRILRNENPDDSENVRNWTSVIHLLEGTQFIEIFDVYFNGSANEEETPLYKEIAPVFLMISDVAGSCLWLLEIGVPLFGPFSESLGLISFIHNASAGTALIGLFVDGSVAIKEFVDLWESDDPKKISALMRIGERTSGVTLIILGFAGVSGPVVIGFGIVASSLGVIRFVYIKFYLNELVEPLNKKSENPQIGEM